MSNIKSILKNTHILPSHGNSAENKKKSYMEIESGLEKIRWLSMAEISSIFGKEFYDSGAFSKIFGTRVSSIIFLYRKYNCIY